VCARARVRVRVRESTVYSAYSENGKRGERDGTSECDRETRRRRRRRR